jgi:hypothetical protein
MRPDDPQWVPRYNQRNARGQLVKRPRPFVPHMDECPIPHDDEFTETVRGYVHTYEYCPLCSLRWQQTKAETVDAEEHRIGP